MAKENHYKEEIEANKNNQGNLWIVINELTNLKNKTKSAPTATK